MTSSWCCHAAAPIEDRRRGGGKKEERHRSCLLCKKTVARRLRERSDCESGASKDTGGERGGGQRVNDRGDRTERGRTLGAWQKHDLCTAQSTWACASGREWAERGGSGCQRKGDGGAGPETWSRPSEHCSSKKRSQDGGKGTAGNARHDDVSDVMSSCHRVST